MRTNVWIFNHYAAPPHLETRVRNNAMAKYLMQAGYNVTIFSASTVHNTDINLITDGSPFLEKEYDGLKFVHINVPKYSGNGISRKLNLLSFPYRLWKYTKKLKSKPDVIVNDLDVMAFDFPFMIANRYRCPIITEVRDLWPESIIEYGMMKRNSLLARFLYAVERRMYIKSDHVVFSMEGGYDYILEKGWGKVIPQEKVHYVNNGVDLSLFQSNKEHYPVVDSDLSNPEAFNVVYTGSIRTVNNLGLLLDAAKNIKNSKIKFLIWGDGDELENLKQRAKDEAIGNVIFKGTVEKQYIPSIVSQADLNIAHNTPSPLFRFGISFNKLFDYLAAERPILSDFPCKYNPAVQWGAGTEVSDPSAENIAKAIESYPTLTRDEIEKFQRNAREASKEFDFANLTEKLIDIIEK